MNLTESITLEMLEHSDKAIKLGITNKADKQSIINLAYLSDKILQPLFEYYNNKLNINSGYRCKALNDAVGSSDSSLHLIGCAADIDNKNHPEIPLIEILSYVYNVLPFTELIAEYFPTGWVHVGIIKGREKEKKLKLKDANHNYSSVSLDYILKLYGGKQ